MSIETSRHVNEFLVSNGIDAANVMGGEFFCHPSWMDVVDTINNAMKDVRLVSNGDWARTKKSTGHVIEFLAKHPGIRVSLSKDKWHSNRHVDAAARACRENGIPVVVECTELGSDETIVPVGRAVMHYNFFSGVARYRASPSHAYSFLIDETGSLYHKSPESHDL
jgi:hypothetical protein